MLIYYQTYLKINHMIASLDPLLVLLTLNHWKAPGLVAFCIAGTMQLRAHNFRVQSLWRGIMDSSSLRQWVI